MAVFTHNNGQYLSVGDADIYFETAGNPQGEPIVLLHGGLGSMMDFKAVLERLSPEFLYIGIDLRGHGKSTMGSEAMCYLRYQQDVEAVLAHLGISACIVLGFSDGGIVGYRLAANSNIQVKKLIALGSQWRLEADDPALPILSGLTSEMWSEIYPDSVGYYQKINPQPDFDRLVKAVVKVWLDQSVTGYPNNAVRHIQCPVLVARGDEDELFSLAEAAELLKQIDNSHFFNIPFAEHAAHQESPEVFVVAVSDFMK